MSGFVGILAASAARRFFFVAEIGRKRGSLGGVWGKIGGGWRRQPRNLFFDWRRVYNIYSIIYSASAEEKFLTGRGEYII